MLLSSNNSFIWTNEHFLKRKNLTDEKNITQEALHD